MQNGLTFFKCLFQLAWESEQFELFKSKTGLSKRNATINLANYSVVVSDVQDCMQKRLCHSIIVITKCPHLAIKVLHFVRQTLDGLG